MEISTLFYHHSVPHKKFLKLAFSLLLHINLVNILNVLKNDPSLHKPEVFFYVPSIFVSSTYLKKSNLAKLQGKSHQNLDKTPNNALRPLSFDNWCCLENQTILLHNEKHDFVFLLP